MKNPQLSPEDKAAIQMGHPWPTEIRAFKQVLSKHGPISLTDGQAAEALKTLSQFSDRDLLGSGAQHIYQNLEQHCVEFEGVTALELKQEFIEALAQMSSWDVTVPTVVHTSVGNVLLTPTEAVFTGIQDPLHSRMDLHTTEMELSAVLLLTQTEQQEHATTPLDVRQTLRTVVITGGHHVKAVIKGHDGTDKQLVTLVHNSATRQQLDQLNAFLETGDSGLEDTLLDFLEGHEPEPSPF